MMTLIAEKVSHFSAVELVEYTALALVLILGSLLCLKGFRVLNRFFFPLICCLAAMVMMINWAVYRDEPALFTPLVDMVAPLVK